MKSENYICGSGGFFMSIIAIDIGGTKIKSAIFADGNIRNMEERYAETLDYDKTIEQILELTNLQKKADPQAKGIGVSVAGSVENQTGIIKQSPNLPFPKNLPLKEILEKKTEMCICVGNDMKMSALGELHYGAARGKQNVVIVGIATGVGAAVIINGSLYNGIHNIAGEIGHTYINTGSDAIKCACGKYGCMEAYLSGPSLILKLIGQSGIKSIEIAKKIDKGIKPKDILYNARKSKECENALMELASYVGICIVNVQNYYDPELIIFRGGFIEGIWNYIKHKVKDVVREKSMYPNIPLVLSKLRDKSSLFGVGYFTEQDIRQKSIT